MTIHKHGSAHWSGDIKRGKGTVSTESGVLNQQPYGFNTRFEGEKGTNPEELIGAAHAACFSMALSHGLTEGGNPPTRLSTSATVDYKSGVGITGITLTVRGEVPGMSSQDFVAAAETAKANCPISKALSKTPITLDAALA